MAAIEAFDPGRRGVWVGSPFVSDDEPVLGRWVTSGRPDAFAALEDEMRADDIWRRAGVPAPTTRSASSHGSIRVPCSRGDRLAPLNAAL